MVEWKLKIKQGWRKISPYVWTFVNIYVIITLYEKFGALGILGLLLIFALLFGFRLLRRTHRENFLNGLRMAETAIWGKPLDKDMWEKGELKNTKVKINWKKTKPKTSEMKKQKKS